MALVFNRQKIGVEKTRTTVTVPDDPIARLMYYLSCMCSVLNLDEPNLNRLSDYRNYFTLDEEEKIVLGVLCAKLNPVDLNGLCLFKDENVGSNEFFKINSESMTFAAAQSVLVGQKRVAVKKVMVYSTSWLNRNYLEPMAYCARLLEQLEARTQRRRRNCIIM